MLVSRAFQQIARGFWSEELQVFDVEDRRSEAHDSRRQCVTIVHHDNKTSARLQQRKHRSRDSERIPKMFHRLKACHQGKPGRRVIFGPEQAESDPISNFGPCRGIWRMRWFDASNVLKSKTYQLLEKGSVSRSDIQHAVQIG